MGLWLKCPKCQAINPLSLQVCPACGHNLAHLPREQRVYVIEPPGTPAPKPSPQPAAPEETAPSPPPAAEKAPKAAPKPKRPRKKKETEH
jgi:hypothetical protein